MNPEMLQTALLIANGVVIVLLPLMVLWLGGRIKTSVRESTKNALADYSTRQQQSLTASIAASQRRAQEPDLLTQKQQDVYAQLYARYRRASNDFGAMIDRTTEPDFKAFSRDDLLRYLRHRKARERDAADAITALDRGDTFAMARLMSRLHERIGFRNANTAFNRAKYFEAMNELYLSDAVSQAVEKARECMNAVSAALLRNDGERPDKPKPSQTRDAMAAAVARLLRVMRDELRGRADSARDVQRDIQVFSADGPKREPMNPGLRAPATQRLQ